MPDSAFIDALIGTPSKTPQEIQSGIADARKLGYSDADILKGAQANFGVDVSSYLKPNPFGNDTSYTPSYTRSQIYNQGPQAAGPSRPSRW